MAARRRCPRCPKPPTVTDRRRRLQTRAITPICPEAPPDDDDDNEDNGALPPPRDRGRRTATSAVR
jgi:hypothetical protein